MKPRPWWAGLSLVLAWTLVTGELAAHVLSPEDVVKLLTTAESRTATGLEKAAVDPRIPRLLVLQVGDRWYGLPSARRLEIGRAWLELWRHSSPKGVVSVLDAATQRPVLKYGPGERVILFLRVSPEP